MLDRCHGAHTDGSRPARRFPRPSRTRAAMARDGSIEPRETRAVSLAEGQERHWEWNRARRRSSSGAGSSAGREPQRSDADQDALRDICAPTVAAPRGRRPALETVPASSPESAIPSPARGRCAPLTAYREPAQDLPVYDLFVQALFVQTPIVRDDLIQGQLASSHPEIPVAAQHRPPTGRFFCTPTPEGVCQGSVPIQTAMKPRPSPGVTHFGMIPFEDGILLTPSGGGSAG